MATNYQSHTHGESSPVHIKEHAQMPSQSLQNTCRMLSKHPLKYPSEGKELVLCSMTRMKTHIIPPESEV